MSETIKPVINIDDIDYMDFGDGGKFQAKLGMIGPLIGAKKLGYNITRLQPGKAAFPYHLHHNIEEMFFIIEGEGVLRFDGKEYPIKKGDVIAGPTGHGTAHQIRNTADAELVFLAVSTLETPDVAEYPDSGKYAVICGDLAGGDPSKATFRIVAKKDAGVGYFDGESE